MSAGVLASLLLCAAAQAADPALLKDVDTLYLHREQPGNLEASNKQLKDAKDPALLWRLGRGLIASAGRLAKKEEKLAVLKEAETALKDAVAAAPQDALAHYWLAREMGSANELLRTLGLARSMKKELETALKLDPNLAAAYQTYGELLHQLPGLFGGDKKKAVKELEEALRLTPNDTGRYQALAEGYLDVGRKEDAIAVLKKVAEVKEPADPGAWDADLKDARELLKKLSP